MSAVIETNLGKMTVELFTEQAPKACLNFLKLSKIRYYEYCLFHRIEKDFIAQTGDPLGSGKGGDSIFGLMGGVRFFADELLDKRNGGYVGFGKKGVLGMANSGKDRNASQFFLTLADGIDYLDEQYTAFGRVEGEESFSVLSKINGIICDGKSKPLQKVWIKSIQILNDPYDDPPGLTIPSGKEPSEAFKAFAGIDAAEVLERESEVPREEMEERRRREEAAAQALTLEIIGDLPSADVKPPENVLFVCKLNPMTEDADLTQVFSRFGPIVSCQIIRDKETGHSLGYAFIEFEDVAACEEAYLKMDNVLLDDRRIHVDFSQSVSKLHGMWEAARKKQMRRGGGEDVRLKEGLKGKDYGYEMLFDPGEVKQAAASRRERSPDRRDGRDSRDRAREDGQRKRYGEDRGDRRRDGTDTDTYSRDDRSYRCNRDDRHERDRRDDRKDDNYRRDGNEREHRRR